MYITYTRTYIHIHTYFLLIRNPMHLMMNKIIIIICHQTKRHPLHQLRREPLPSLQQTNLMTNLMKRYVFTCISLSALLNAKQFSISNITYYILHTYSVLFSIIDLVLSVASYPPLSIIPPFEILLNINETTNFVPYAMM